jgi:uncharacterized damage-inducible protein DinB
MSDRELWVDKKFEFGFPVEDHADLLETLASAPGRLEKLLDGISAEGLVRSEGRGWSIQENAGHLINVEELFVGRLDDYEAGKEELRAADMSNRKTGQADYNRADISWITAEFRAVRGRYIDRLQTKSAAFFGVVARHPRLEQPMRVVDQLYFQVAHDAHHFTRIQEIKSGD